MASRGSILLRPYMTLSADCSFQAPPVDFSAEPPPSDGWHPGSSIQQMAAGSHDGGNPSRSTVLGALLEASSNNISMRICHQAQSFDALLGELAAAHAHTLQELDWLRTCLGDGKMNGKAHPEDQFAVPGHRLLGVAQNGNGIPDYSSEPFGLAAATKSSAIPVPPASVASQCDDLPGADESSFKSEALALDVGKATETDDDVCPTPPPRKSLESDEGQNSQEVGQQRGYLHDCWKEDGSSSSFASELRYSTRDFLRVRFNDKVAGDAVVAAHCLQRAVTHPNSEKRMLWDFISIFVLMYDIFWVPFQVFEPDRTSMSGTVELVCTIFWTLDIVFNFLTGFHRDSLIEMRLSRIAIRYGRSWLPFDGTVLSIDWLYLFVDEVSGPVLSMKVARMGKSLRLMRIIRSIRLLRVVKLQQFMHSFMESVQSEYARTVLEIAALLFSLLVFSHFIACGWYLVGDLNDSATSWVKRRDIRLESVGLRYSTALHWAVSQFTLSSMEISPGNVTERWYAIAVLLLALVFFSTFVSCITTLMAHLWEFSAAQKKYEVQLRRYFYDNQISVELANRIHLFLKEKHYGKRRVVHERDLSVLKLLPDCLMQQLHVEVYCNTLVAYPFLFQVQQQDAVVLSELCNFAMTEEPVEARGIVFQEAKLSTKVYFIVRGELAYVCVAGKQVVESVALEAGRWIAEASMWVKWWHRGKAVAATSCEIQALDTVQFRTIMLHRPESTISSARKFAKAFAEELETNDITDVGFSFDRLQEWAQDAFVIHAVSRRPSLDRMCTRQTNISDMSDERKTRRLPFNFSMQFQNLLSKMGSRFDREC